MQEIRDDGLLLVVYGNSGDIPEGRNFYGTGKDYLQWGTQNLKKDTLIQPHIHKVRSRQFESKTIEAFIVLEGILQVDVYTLNQKLLESVALEPGGFMVAYDGGHGFKALVDGTKFLEVKLGDFTSVLDDKVKF